MPKAKMNVKLLEFSQNALSIIYAACRQCYSPKFAGEIFDEGMKDPEKEKAFVKSVISSGHESPVEHVKFTFAIEGVSRALTHQLVRHRVASYSQQSQRYVKENEFEYVVPPSIEGDPEMMAEYLGAMEGIQNSYNRLLAMYAAKGKKGEAANQDARFVLPQASETKIVVTMNCRELLHFFKERCCARAQWEIRSLADEMLRLCKEALPEVFEAAGAKCEILKYCPEGEKFTCGRYPVVRNIVS